MNTITFKPRQFKKVINQWEFITEMVKFCGIKSDLTKITFGEKHIIIAFEKEAHSLDLEDIANIIGCKNAILGKDDYSNDVICGF